MDQHFTRRLLESMVVIIVVVSLAADLFASDDGQQAEIKDTYALKPKVIEFCLNRRNTPAV